MRLIKLMPIWMFCITVQAGRPLSGLNTQDFFDVQKSLIQWGENPFIRNEDVSSFDDLTLFAVVYSKNKSSALINDQIVSVGEMIGSFEVMSIKKREVILRNENGIFKLLFKRSKNEKI